MSVSFFSLFFFFNDTATTEIYTLSLHDALPICDFPSSTLWCRRSTFSHWWILLLAREVLTKVSQSWLGLWAGLVRISTMSPLDRSVLRGTSFPLIRAPTQRWPTSVCTE